MKTCFSSKTWSFFNAFGGFWYVKVYVLHISTYTTVHHQQLYGPLSLRMLAGKLPFSTPNSIDLAQEKRWGEFDGWEMQVLPIKPPEKNRQTPCEFWDILVCTTPSQTHVFPVTQHRLHRNMTRCFCFRWLFCWRGVMLVEVVMMLWTCAGESLWFFVLLPSAGVV